MPISIVPSAYEELLCFPLTYVSMWVMMGVRCAGLQSASTGSKDARGLPGLVAPAALHSDSPGPSH